MNQKVNTSTVYIVCVIKIAPVVYDTQHEMTSILTDKAD